MSGLHGPAVLNCRLTTGNVTRASGSGKDERRATPLRPRLALESERWERGQLARTRSRNFGGSTRGQAVGRRYRINAGSPPGRPLTSTAPAKEPPAAHDADTL